MSCHQVITWISAAALLWTNCNECRWCDVTVISMAWCITAVSPLLTHYIYCILALSHRYVHLSWWRHQMETFSALLALCAGNSPVTGEFPSQRPVTRSIDVFFDLRLNKRLDKQSCGWWFETSSRSLWRHCNGDLRMEIVPEETGEVVCGLCGDVVEVDAMANDVHHWKYTGVNSLLIVSQSW